MAKPSSRQGLIVIVCEDLKHCIKINVDDDQSTTW